MENTHLLVSLMIGVGLAAAAGFRIFLPLLVMSLAARYGYFELASNLDWISTTPALVVFATATTLEIGAYYLPWIDNALDLIATPTAIAAGATMVASTMGELDPMVQWMTGIVLGGGTSGGVQALTVLARATSTATTAGLGNPLFSTGETGASLGMALLAIFLPLFAILALVLLAALLLTVVVRRRRHARRASGETSTGAAPQ